MELTLLVGAGLAALTIIAGTVIAWRVTRHPSGQQPESLRAVDEIIRACFGRKA